MQRYLLREVEADVPACSTNMMVSTEFDAVLAISTLQSAASACIDAELDCAAGCAGEGGRPHGGDQQPRRGVARAGGRAPGDRRRARGSQRGHQAAPAAPHHVAPRAGLEQVRPSYDHQPLAYMRPWSVTSGAAAHCPWHADPGAICSVNMPHLGSAFYALRGGVFVVMKVTGDSVLVLGWHAQSSGSVPHKPAVVREASAGGDLVRLAEQLRESEQARRSLERKVRDAPKGRRNFTLALTAWCACVSVSCPQHGVIPVRRGQDQPGRLAAILCGVWHAPDAFCAAASLSQPVNVYKHLSYDDVRLRVHSCDWGSLAVMLTS